MEVGCVASQLRAQQAGRSRRSGEGKEEAKEVGAWIGKRLEEAVGMRSRRIGRVAQHVFLVISEGGDEVEVG